MTDAKSAMLEIALRAVQQHIERDEYTEAGDVVMQALARVEQMIAPADLVRRLLADHQRVEPHHADKCQLCREAQAAIEGQPPMSDLSSRLRAYAEGLRTGDLNEFDSTMFALIEAAERLEQQDIECATLRHGLRLANRRADEAADRLRQEEIMGQVLRAAQGERQPKPDGMCAVSIDRFQRRVGVSFHTQQQAVAYRDSLLDATPK